MAKGAPPLPGWRTRAQRSYHIVASNDMTTLKRSRLRHILRWATTGACALVILTWLLGRSFVYGTSGYTLGYGGETWAIECRYGRITWYTWTKAIARERCVLPEIEQWPDWPERANNEPARGWYRSATEAENEQLKDIIFFVGPPWLQHGSLGGYSPGLRRGTLHLSGCLLGTLVFARIVSVILWTGHFRRWRLQRSLPPFHCASCGYDLTANASGICPECGTALKPTTGNSEQDS